MNEPILTLHFWGQAWVVTAWKLVGYTGVGIFSARWVVQVLASYRAGRSHIPELFWYLSLAGSILVLSYFTFSEKNDSVGILSNLFPSIIATYNIFLVHRARRKEAARLSTPPPPSATH